MLFVVLMWCFSNDRRFAPPKNNGKEMRKPEVQLNKQHQRDIPNLSWFSLQTFLSHQRCVIFYIGVNRRKEYLCISPQYILFFLSNFISLCLLDEQFSDQWTTRVQSCLSFPLRHVWPPMQPFLRESFCSSRGTPAGDLVYTLSGMES